MGQRHQLFVIAKVGAHYRSLAAVHHQWLYGLAALQRCLRLLNIFSDETNRIALQQELNFAFDYFCNKEPPPTERPKLLWEGLSLKPCPFPFITTCLMIGSSYDDANIDPAGVSEEPFGMGYDQGDNNDGITVLDITDLSSPEDFDFGDEDNYSAEADDRRELRRKLHQPLSGWEYLLGYFKRSQPSVQRNISVPTTLDNYSLVKLETLNETWPYGPWDVDISTTQGSPSSGLSILQPTASLQEQAIRKLVDATLASEDFDPATWDDLLQIHGFQQSLPRELIRNADQIGLSSASMMLFALAYANEQALDLSPFVNLRAELLKDALERKEFSMVTTVNASSIAATQSPADLWKALSVLKNLKCIYILDRPDRESDDAGIQTFLTLAASHPDLIMEKLVVSASFSRALRKSSWFPTVENRTALMAAFPIAQLLVWHGDSTGYGESYAFEYFSLVDALLNPVRLVTGLFQYLETLTEFSYPRWDGTGMKVANCFAMSSSSLGGNRSFEVGPLPAETYKRAKAAYHSNIHQGCYSTMRDLRPGEWTILVSRDCKADGPQMPISVGIKYAFIRSKITISAKPSSDEQANIKHEDLEVVDVAGFLQQVAPHVDSRQLQYHFNSIQERISKSRNMGPAEDGILTFLQARDVCKLLDQFISNVPVVNEAVERARKFDSPQR
ncbi:hypothetical protein B7463_g10555, partial [Scytalidium lignicola]